MGHHYMVLPLARYDAKTKRKEEGHARRQGRLDTQKATRVIYWHEGRSHYDQSNRGQDLVRKTWCIRFVPTRIYGQNNC